MAKYRVVIEFETDKDLPFPADAILLEHMEAQLDYLADGMLADELNDERFVVTTPTPSKIIKLGLCSKCGDCLCGGCSR